MGAVYKGTVLSVEDKTCRVAPVEDIDQVSAKLIIPSYVEELSKGDLVAFSEFADCSGVVICKL